MVFPIVVKSYIIFIKGLVNIMYYTMSHIASSDGEARITGAGGVVVRKEHGYSEFEVVEWDVNQRDGWTFRPILPSWFQAADRFANTFSAWAGSCANKPTSTQHCMSW